MRLRLLVVPVLTAAITVLPSAPVNAGGWDSLNFPREHYLAGQVASVRSEFFAGALEGTGSLDGGPYYAYLLPERRDELFAMIEPPTIPEGAIRLGALQIEGTVVHDGGRYGVASLTFTVPEVPTGRYPIGFCDDPCTHSTVGWLAWGSITVVHTQYEGALLGRIERLEQQHWSLKRDVRKAERKTQELRATLGDVRATLQAARDADASSTEEPVSAPAAALPSTPRESPVTRWVALMAGALGIGVGAMLGRRRRQRSPVTVEVPRRPFRIEREREPELERELAGASGTMGASPSPRVPGSSS